MEAADSAWQLELPEARSWTAGIDKSYQLNSWNCQKLPAEQVELPKATSWTAGIAKSYQLNSWNCQKLAVEQLLAKAGSTVRHGRRYDLPITVHIIAPSFLPSSPAKLDTTPCWVVSLLPSASVLLYTPNPLPPYKMNLLGNNAKFGLFQDWAEIGFFFFVYKTFWSEER